MKKLIFICMILCLAGCAEKKPPLTPTQVVNGKSIVMPPEFFVLPKINENTSTTPTITEE